MGDDAWCDRYSCFCLGVFDTTLYYITVSCSYYFETDVCIIIIHLLHPILLNTKIYYTQGGMYATEGVINLVFNIVEGAITVLLYM